MPQKSSTSGGRSVGQGGADGNDDETCSGIGTDSIHAVHGPEEGLTFYRLLASNEKRLAREDMRVDSQTGGAKPSAGELACDIWLTSFQPRPLPVQGEAKFSLRCRIWEMAGVTSPEERNILQINGLVIRQKAVLMLYGDRVSSSHCDRSKDKEKKTMFNGSLISLDTRANMATDMLKFVVQQKVSPVELVYKPVATVSIPLRSVPVVFPGDESLSPGSNSAAGTADAAGCKRSEASASATGSRRRSKLCLRGGGGNGGVGEEEGRSLWDSPGEEPRARKYRLQTLAGPLTSRTMDNGFVVMSLTLVPHSNDLLGEQDPEDSENVKVPPPPPPPPLATRVLDVSFSCGYQRLRKALLWNDSKLMAAFSDMLNYSETTHSPWVDTEGGAGHQQNLAGCKRSRAFVIPKSAIVAANLAEADDVVLADGPSLMAYEKRVRTPGVYLGDKFVVVVQMVLIKEGPDKCRLQTSAEAVFNEKVMGLIQGQVVSAVGKVTKENHRQLQGLIEDAISGRAGAGAGGAGRRRGAGEASRKTYWCWCLGTLVVLGACLLMVWGALSISGDGAAGLQGSAWRRSLSFGRPSVSTLSPTAAVKDAHQAAAPDDPICEHDSAASLTAA